MAITRREALLRRQKHAAANGKNVKSRKECLSFFSCYFETAGVSQTPTLKTTAAVVYTRNGVDALKLRYISGIDRSITDHRPDILGYNLAGCCGWLWFSDSPAASSRCAVISQLSRSICHAVMPPFSLSGTRYGIFGTWYTRTPYMARIVHAPLLALKQPTYHVWNTWYTLTPFYMARIVHASLLALKQPTPLPFQEPAGASRHVNIGTPLTFFFQLRHVIRQTPECLNAI